MIACSGSTEGAIAKSKPRQSTGPRRHEIALTRLEGLLESLEADGSVGAGTHARLLAVLIGKLGEDARCTNVIETACIDLADILAKLQTCRGPDAGKVWEQVDEYRVRRVNLGRHSNVSPRFLAERDTEKKWISAALRSVLREMKKREQLEDRRTTMSKSQAFDANYWARRLVKEVRRRARRRASPPPRPLAYTTVVASNGGARRVGGEEWWNVALARKMLFGDNKRPHGTMDALPVATATRWLLTQLYGHENTIKPGSWTSYVKDGRREIAKDRAKLRQLRRRKRGK
jgi:hypothetical protein